MVPANHVLRPAYRLAYIDVVEQVLFTFLTSADTRLRALLRQWDDIQDVHRLADREALHAAHDLHIVASLRVHHHLDQSDGRNLAVLEVMRILLPWSLIRDQVVHPFLVPMEQLLVADRVFKLKSTLRHVRLGSCS